MVMIEDDEDDIDDGPLLISKVDIIDGPRLVELTIKGYPRVPPWIPWIPPPGGVTGILVQPSTSG